MASSQPKNWMDRNGYWLAPVAAVVSIGGAFLIVRSGQRETKRERMRQVPILDVLARVALLGAGVGAAAGVLAIAPRGDS